LDFLFICSGETGFAGLAKNPEFVAAIQKSFANQENKDDVWRKFIVYESFLQSN
jgi:hypothetical protein